MNSQLEPLPPIEALQAFMAAFRLGSLSAAAAELGVTHGAVSRRIHAVETWLGARLFDRHGRGVAATPVGENFARRVERALSQISALRSDIAATNRAAPIRLSVLPSFARLWLVPRLARLEGEPADLSIRVIPEHRMASLERREADIAIRFGLGEWPGAEAHRLMREVRVAVAVPEIAARLRNPADVLAERLLHDDDGSDWRVWCRAAGQPFRPAGGERRFDDYDLVLLAAQSGLGVAIARRPLADEAILSGHLAIVPGPAVKRAEGHFVVTRSGETRANILKLRDRLISLAAEPYGASGLPGISDRRGS